MLRSELWPFLKLHPPTPEKVTVLGARASEQTTKAKGSHLGGPNPIRPQSLWEEIRTRTHTEGDRVRTWGEDAIRDPRSEASEEPAPLTPWSWSSGLRTRESESCLHHSVYAANTTLTGWGTDSLSPQVGNKTRMLAFATSIQHIALGRAIGQEH